MTDNLKGKITREFVTKNLDELLERAFKFHMGGCKECQKIFSDFNTQMIIRALKHDKKGMTEGLE